MINTTLSYSLPATNDLENDIPVNMRIMLGSASIFTIIQNSKLTFSPTSDVYAGDYAISIVLTDSNS